jgi:hypothetical protein
MRKFAQFLILAQIASNSGKGWKSYSQNAATAVREGYYLKDEYIHQAIKEAKNLKNVTVSRGKDMGMTVVYFDVKGYGQVSFHSFSKFSKLRKKGKWNGILGGSELTCTRLNKKFRLGLLL